MYFKALWLFYANLIFHDILRNHSKFKYFSSLYEPCYRFHEQHTSVLWLAKVFLKLKAKIFAQKLGISQTKNNSPFYNLSKSTKEDKHRLQRMHFLPLLPTETGAVQDFWKGSS